MANYLETREGTTLTPLKFRLTLDGGTYAEWASGTIQIFDALGDALSTFASAAACTVSGTDDEYLEWTPVWGTSSGQLPDISVETKFYIEWKGIQVTTAKVYYSERIAWTIKPRG